jgi:hypothetical protein
MAGNRNVCKTALLFDQARLIGMTDKREKQVETSRDRAAIPAWLCEYPCQAAGLYGTMDRCWTIFCSQNWTMD